MIWSAESFGSKRVTACSISVAVGRVDLPCDEELGRYAIQEQYDRTQTWIKEMGLEVQVAVEIRDYNYLDGTDDKTSSIGMYEHIGLATIPG